MTFQTRVSNNIILNYVYSHPWYSEGEDNANQFPGQRFGGDKPNWCL